MQPLHEQSIAQLQTAMTQGKLTCEELIWHCLERIASLDSGGPKLHSILELNPDALVQAQLRDAQRRQGHVLGPLHGIPVVLKDSIDSGESMHTTNGSCALAQHYAKADAFLVEKLRQAGAIILAKNNLSEWYDFLSESTPNGFSNLGGQIKNPYGDRYIPGGSSGGTAVSVAAGLATIGIGTDTAGSIVEPASKNSVVGFKPTPGVISRSGCLPLTLFQDSPGPIARHVEDIAIAMNILCAADPEDPGHWRAQALSHTDFTQGLDGSGLRHLRLGLVGGAFLEDMDDHAQAAVAQAVSAMEQAGATVVPVTNCLAEQMAAHPESYPDRPNIDVLYHEFKVRLNRYLAGMEESVPVHSLKELLDYHHENPACGRYGQSYLEQVEQVDRPLLTSAFVTARKRDIEVYLERSVRQPMLSEGLDALIFASMSAQGVGARAGCPTLTVPAGFSPDSGPVGLTFAALPLQDQKLIQIGYAFEQVLPARRPPRFF